MRAVVYETYGGPSVLQVKQLDRPTPGDDEILINVRATAINYGEVTARNMGNISADAFNMPYLFWLGARLEFGLRKPKNPILGSEFSGTVAAIGRNVKSFGVGDAVFGYRGSTGGANAEYLCMPATGIVVRMPANLSFAEAATIPYGGLTALKLLEKAAIQPGEKVLIIGASGGIGAIALQLAKQHFGAHVTAVCGPKNVDYVTALGADDVVDYTREDFTERGKQYDLILDVLGRGSWLQDRKALTANGRYLYASFKLRQLLYTLRSRFSKSQRCYCVLAAPKSTDLQFIAELIEAGKLKPIIDKCFPLDKSAQAHAYYEDGQAHGRVVITIS